MRYNHTQEAWEEEQMSNLGCESVSDLIAEVIRLRGKVLRLEHRVWHMNEGDEEE